MNAADRLSESDKVGGDDEGSISQNCFYVTGKIYRSMYSLDLFRI